MRSTDRDYYVSTLSVIQNSLSNIHAMITDIEFRLEELETSLILTFDQQEDQQEDYPYSGPNAIEMEEFASSGLIYDSMMTNKTRSCTCDPSN